MALPTNVLSLCAGGGGLDLGVGLAVPDARTVCYVENEVTAAAVLVANMEAERLPAAPLWTDLRTFDGRAWRGVVDIVTGGYPCQPFSNAGKRLGTADPRHLWPDVRRIVGEVEPEWCFFENVGAHLRLGFHEVARGLQCMGYRVAAGLFTASEVGAPHKRERLFIMAHSRCNRRRAGAVGRSEGAGSEGADRPSERGGHVGNSGSERRWQEGHVREFATRLDRAGNRVCWPPRPGDDWSSIPERLWPATVEPSVRGMADGLAGGLGRSDQLHVLGNGVVPQQAAYAWRILEAAISNNNNRPIAHGLFVYPKQSRFGAVPPTDEEGSGEFTLGHRRFLLRRVAFPKQPSPEWFVVDLLQHAEQAAADRDELTAALADAVSRGRFDPARLQAMAKEYGSRDTQARVASALGLAMRREGLGHALKDVK